MSWEEDDSRFPLLHYLLTYGNYEFVSGQTRIPVAFNLAQALTAVLNQHHSEVVTANGGAGSALNEMYNQFVTRQESIGITAQPVGVRGEGAMGCNLGDTVGFVAQYNCLYVRFHLDALGTPQQGVTDFRKRLHRFYNYYNPEKLVIADRMLQDARGFEEELLQTLALRYGPEPAPAVDLRFRDRLTAFYHHYNPDRVGEVDEILLEYSGMEEQLFSALVAKYGPEPIIIGSEADSDDSFTYTNNTERDTTDPYPLAVPLMPFITPLHEYELPPDTGGEGEGVAHLEFSGDVHFWDNFVNQMPGGAPGEEGDEGAGKGIDCNQDLLRQFLRSYPLLFPHIVTATCPYKEQVFRGSHEFWQYLKARAEANAGRVEEADASHVVRCVSSQDTKHPPLFITRREWQDLIDDWEQAHGLERRVQVGSVALDGAMPLQLPQRPPPTAEAAQGAVVTEKRMQTVVDSNTQTHPPKTPPPPPPPPPREPTPPPPPPPPPPPAQPSSPHTGRLAHVSGRALPVAWPIATLAQPSSPSRQEDTEPPLDGDSTMEPYLKAALAEVQQRKAARGKGRAATIETQTTGWVPPSAGGAAGGGPVLTRVGPSPRKGAGKLHAPPRVPEPYTPGFEIPMTGLLTMKVTPSDTPLSSPLPAPQRRALQRPPPGAYPVPHAHALPDDQYSTGDDFAEVLTPHAVLKSLTRQQGESPRRSPPRPGGSRALLAAAASLSGPTRPPADAARQRKPLFSKQPPSSLPSSTLGGDYSRDKYWKAFLEEMQSVTK